jgi:hypothetical protein
MDQSVLILEEQIKDNHCILVPTLQLNKDKALHTGNLKFAADNFEGIHIG